MPMNINTNQANLFRFGSRAAQNAKGYGGWPNSTRSANAGQNVNSIRRMLSESRRADQGGIRQDAAYSSSILDSTASYADSLRAARTKAKNTSLKLKKLQYSFKAISAQILRSKTSASARQVAGRARREVIRLKRQRQSGEYDSEELQSAIAHAQAMERVAKKKARHLLEEELVKVTGGPCAGELEEREEQESGAVDDALEETQAEEMPLEEDCELALTDEFNEAAQERMQAYQDISQQQMEELQAMMQVQMEEISDSMRELLEETELLELADSMLASADVEMDPADYEMMKRKHRQEELKAIAKADAEYLKAVFDRLEKQKSASAGGIFGSNGSTAAGGGVSLGGGVPAVSGGSAAVPSSEGGIVSGPDALAVSAPEVGGGIDISV